MAAPFRIVRGTRADEDGLKDYLERLIKMIPGEVVGLYLIGNGLIPADQVVGSAVWAGICLLLIIFVRLYGTSDGPDKPPQPFPVFVAAVAFVIWVYSMGGPFAKIGNLYYPWVGSLAVLVWSFVIPKFYKGPADSSD